MPIAIEDMFVEVVRQRLTSGQIFPGTLGNGPRNPNSRRMMRPDKKTGIFRLKKSDATSTHISPADKRALKARRKRLKNRLKKKLKPQQLSLKWFWRSYLRVNGFTYNYFIKYLMGDIYKTNEKIEYAITCYLRIQMNKLPLERGVDQKRGF
jgi:hypothetical protein